MSVYLTAKVAVRYWSVASNQEVSYLRSVGFTSIWPQEYPLKAFCAKGYFDDLHATSCKCGIYSLKSNVDEKYIESGGGSVFGSVYIWGKVIECEYGYRSEYAYPESLKCFSCIVCRKMCYSDSNIQLGYLRSGFIVSEYKMYMSICKSCASITAIKQQFQYIPLSAESLLKSLRASYNLKMR